MADVCRRGEEASDRSDRGVRPSEANGRSTHGRPGYRTSGIPSARAAVVASSPLVGPRSTTNIINQKPLCAKGFELCGQLGPSVACRSSIPRMSCGSGAW